jgi:RNA polymerase sigma factor (sigma-70 family)
MSASDQNAQPVKGRNTAMEPSWASLMAATYTNNASNLMRLAYTLTGSRSDAQDLVHEAFARVFSKTRRMRTEADLVPYLRRTTVNLARRRWKRLNREVLRPSVAHLDIPAGAHARVDDPFWDHFLKLPLRQRAVIFFRHYEGHTEHETAELLDCSVTAVRSLAHRGLRRLREVLDENAASI